MKRNQIRIIVGAAALLICLLVCYEIRNQPAEIIGPVSSSPMTDQSVTTTTQLPGESEVMESPQPYVSPVDFEALWKVNEDIYAWLEIPGTDISYPLLQHPEDDSYYLRRNVEGKRDSNGVLFTEASYNGKDFTDPLTIVYGHNMNNEKMFGTLQQEYSSQTALEEHSEVIIFLPEQELHYTVFAAVPFDNRHILYNYDFTQGRTFRLFFQEILSVRALEAVYAQDASIQSDDRALILSTCLTGDINKRFLICGKLSQTIPEEI